MDRVFTGCAQEWRGLGALASSGLVPRDTYAHFDARRRLGGGVREKTGCDGCLAGEVLTGRIRPDECPRFGRECTPESPLGAPMVSGEGACAAYFRYRAAPALRRA